MGKDEPWLDGLADDWVPQLSISPAENSPDQSIHLDETGRDPTSDRLPTAQKSSEPLPHSAEGESHDNDDPFLPSQTIQVRATSGAQATDAPEWKRRILQGEVAQGERTDLFAPIGLESIFRPPNDDNPARIESLRARLGSRGSEKPAQTHERQLETTASDMAASAPAPSTSQTPDTHFPLNPQRKRTSLLRSEATDKPDRNRLSPPIEQSELEEGNSAEFSSIRITSDLYKKRPSSANGGNDSVNRDQADAADAALEMTSQSLPEGLSMGTQDPSSLDGFVNTRRGGHSDEGSFLKRRLSPSSIPSKLHPSNPGSSQLWSSPSQSGNPSIPPTSKSTSSRPATTENTHSTRPNGQNADDQHDPHLGQSGSPLKLFDNHDTFTNKRLLRRMGQFEKTLDDYSEEELELPEDDDSSPTKPQPARRNSKAQNDSNGHEPGKGSLEPSLSKKPQQSHPQSGNTATGTRKKSADWLKRQKLEPSETKRARNSPTKDSSPKRRRTLRVPDTRNDLWHEPLLHSSEFMSRNDFEDSQSDEVQAGEQAEEPPPEKPSARARSSLNVHDPSSGGPRFPSSRPSSRRTENGDNAENRPRSVGNHVGQERRRGSITTQDFFDEATKIMKFIRENGRTKPKSGLADLAESDNPPDDYGDESSGEEFVRPPSREFSGGFRRRTRRPPNPRIVSHLKKFEENDEQDMFMGASATSLRLRRGAGSLERTLGSRSTDRDGNKGEVENSPKTLGAREAFHMLRRRHSFSGDGSELFDDFDTGDIHPSLSTRKSIDAFPTAYSQNSGENSGKRGIISSNMISHLIPGQVGKMVYDHDEQRWVRGEHDPRHETSQVVGEVSEEDPFQDIPDLSVDELQELINARDFVEYSPPTKQDDAAPGSSVPARANHGMGSSQSRADSAPQTTEGTSTVHSKSTRFTGSYPKPETRATSWATEDIVPPPKPSMIAEEGTTNAPDESLHESRVHDGYLSPVTSPQRNPEKQARAVTITFSSPVVSHVAYSAGDGELQEENPLPSTPSQPRTRSHALPESPAENSLNRSGRERPSSGRSYGRQMLSGRPVSRIDEGSEDSDDEADVDLSMAPINDNGERSVVSHRRNNPDTSYSFQLSPLPDFTVNQVDQSMQLEVSYVAERTNPKSLRQVHGTFALAAETLVKAITDTEPFEIYWDQLQQLDIRDKNLITLLKLNQFCPRIEDLDASNNRIGQLSGVPSSIRSLNVAGNCLSNMTAWTHLSNLQYVDVSNNELENLDGVSGLVHLRGLKANGNRIRNVGGVFGLDGLLSLELKDNALEEVDFGEAELFRLKSLDLSGNQLSGVTGVECLSTLETLDLRDNQLGQFEVPSTLQQLRSLKLSRNRLSDVDISPFPYLRLLYVDCNNLPAIRGLDGCEHLEALSMREQTSASDRKSPLTVDLDLCSMPALRKLYLSSNKLSPSLLVPQSPVANLRLLDVASCSLERLPHEFGANFATLKALNLNFNALDDIARLEGVTQLSRLTLVGNRISRLRRLCHVLRLVGGKSGTLRKVDLRGNPLTVGFYPAPVSGSGRRQQQPLRIEDKTSRDVVRTRRHSDADADEELGLKPIVDCSDIALRAGESPGTVERRRDEQQPQLQLGHGEAGVNVEVDDPYTIPPADPVADEKYLVHLDEATQLRRRVVELMVGSATAGQLRVLDGLDVKTAEGKREPKNGETKGTKRTKGVRKDWVWERLVELGVLKKRELNG